MALALEQLLQQCNAALEQVPQALQTGLASVPQDMVVSMVIGLGCCGVFLTLGNTKKIAPALEGFKVSNAVSS